MAAWHQRREQWAEDLGRSLLFWYRQEYHLPRHDPRLDDLTWETLWVERRAWEIYHTPVPSVGEQLTDAWLDAIEAGTVDPLDPGAEARFREAWYRAHPEARAAEGD